MTVLVGRNASGKSNAFDAIALLALLADGRDLNDVERGDKEVAGLRGGISGAAPFDSRTVKVGCIIGTANGDMLELEVKIDAGGSPEIVSEKLIRRRTTGRDLVLLDASRQGPQSGIADVQVYSGGAPRTYHFLSSRLITAQALTKILTDTRARQLVVDSCNELISVLRGVFVLDPVPAQMRSYSRIGSTPDRSGSTVSAIAYELQTQPTAWNRLYSLMSGLVETDLQEITFSEGRLPDQRLIDVMVALVERAGQRNFTAPAQIMSDGTLRYLSIVSSLLSLGGGAHSPPDRRVRRTMLVEEIENGLFPSQSAHVLSVLRDEARTREVQLVFTTHSPALLDALERDDHKGVVICERNADGWSTLQPLTQHRQYVDIAGNGKVGRALTAGALHPDQSPPPLKLSELLDSV